MATLRKRRPEGADDAGRHNTIKGLADAYFSHGRRALQEVFQAQIPEELSSSLTRRHYVVKAGYGRPTSRTDADHKDGIRYDNYSPPAVWESPYSLLKVKFDPIPKTDLMFHPGEELIAPTNGRIVYKVFWSPGAQPAEEQLTPPVESRSVMRIDPSVPHHTWALDSGGAEAWMIFHPLTGSTSSINVESAFPSYERQRHNRVTPDELRTIPGRYALIAWGIADKIRRFRQLANMTIGDLARRVDLDPSYMSRIEDANANVSLPVLFRIAQMLHMNLSDSLPPNDWVFEAATFPDVNGSDEYVPLLSNLDNGRHFLHPVLWNLRAGARVADALKPNLHSDRSSWIILRGRVIFELHKKNPPELLDMGSVIHFHGERPKEIHAQEHAEVLEVRYSPGCICKRKQ